jgi:3-oxoacyl-ACP reductase-like protein
MSFFTRIKDAIFGKAQAAPAPAPKPTPSAPASSPSPSTQPAPAATPTPVVDVEAILTEMASKQSQKLNWRTSIVDLMKLVGLDSSLQNRKELAQELGYTGDMNDSASMNIWLHKQVMKKLAEHGGKVPAELRD